MYFWIDPICLLPLVLLTVSLVKLRARRAVDSAPILYVTSESKNLPGNVDQKKLP